jgi:hypothetical protein
VQLSAPSDAGESVKVPPMEQHVVAAGLQSFEEASLIFERING